METGSRAQEAHTSVCTRLVQARASCTHVVHAPKKAFYSLIYVGALYERTRAILFVGGFYELILHIP